MLKRALISVYDKTGIIEFARFLVSKNIEIVSSSGTYQHLIANGINAIEVNEITKHPEILDGRVKTLHPKIHGGILALRDNKNHMDMINNNEIQLIDLVVVNLYPFNEVRNLNLSLFEQVAYIDIGGPAMIRAAAKSFRDVIPICDINDYKLICNEIELHGDVSFELRKALASKVFSLTATYDALISSYLNNDKIEQQYLNVSYKKMNNLLYGENLHQRATFYVDMNSKGAMRDFKQLNGKELSFNNIRDMDFAWRVVSEFDDIACCGVKHSIPCGFAIGDTAKEAYKKMYDSDQVSIFGGIVAFNKEVTIEVAENLVATFLELIIAPAFTKEAIELLRIKKNLRVIEVQYKPQNTYEYITVDGGLLVQEVDSMLMENEETVTNRKPTKEEEEDLKIAFKLVKHVKSNAIVIVKDKVTLAVKGGYTNRILATQSALEFSKEVSGAVLASDGFFPFNDCVKECAKYGIKAIIQPGGSIRDGDSINLCNEHDIVMMFANVRHFRH